MKKTTMGVISVALLALGLAAGIVMVPAKTARADEIPVVKENFPDEKLRNWVFKKFDGTISEEEIDNTKEVDLSGLGIKDLTGIEYFTEIEKFNCSNNDITKLNLTTFHNLWILNCDNTKITSLNTNKNRHVMRISCLDCPITNIDLAGTEMLSEFYVRSADLDLVDLSMNKKLEEVSVESGKSWGLLLLPDVDLNNIDVKAPSGWTQTTLSEEFWSVKETNWILDDPSGYDYADITFQYDPDILPYEVTVRTYALLTKVIDASCEKNGEYDYEATLQYELSRTGKEVTVYETFEIPATGHDWGDWFVSKQATVKEEGEEKRICRHDASHVQTKKLKKITPTPTKKPVVTLTLNKKNAEVVAGKTTTLKATVKGSTNAVTWKSSNSKIATVNKNGKITAKQAGKVTITASCAGKTAKCVVQVLFKDLTNQNDFWYKPTYYLNDLGIVKGYADQTEFRANNQCSRAQVVTFLYRLMGEPKTKSSTCRFTDVISSDYYYKAVIWASEKGISTGSSKNRFNPQGLCTRAHVVTFLWRMAGKPEPKNGKCRFCDIQESDYFYKAAIWANEKGILSGYSDGTFRPNGDCLRKHLVTFLYKYDMKINKKG